MKLVETAARTYSLLDFTKVEFANMRSYFNQCLDMTSFVAQRLNLVIGAIL